MTDRLRVGIVGSGFMATVHARAALRAGACLAAVATRSGDAAVAHRLGAARAVSTLDELLDDVDVVHICTPNYVHEEQARAALAAGVHLICEKPLSVTADAARDLARTAQRTGLTATVPFVYRYYGVIRQMRALVQDAGSLVHVRGSYLQDWLADPAATDWRVDPALGGASRAFADIGVHWADLAEFVTGQRIARVITQTTTVHAHRHDTAQPVLTEDLAGVLFETIDGIPGQATVSQVSWGRTNKLQLRHRRCPRCVGVLLRPGRATVGRRPGRCPAGTARPVDRPRCGTARPGARRSPSGVSGRVRRVRRRQLRSDRRRCTRRAPDFRRRSPRCRHHRLRDAFSRVRHLGDGADPMTRHEPTRVSLLVIGSGPVGATFARETLDRTQSATVLVTDAGPQLTKRPGANIRNLPVEQRAELQARVSGEQPPRVQPMGSRPVYARPGTQLLRPDDGTGDGQTGMPAAAVSINVGGMGAHWTCAVPRPSGSERIPFLAAADLDAALDRAEQLLHATTSAFAPSAAGAVVLDTLSRRYDTGRPQNRKTGPMPLACAPSGNALPHWSGADTVLGGPNPRLIIRPSAVARRLFIDADHVVGAEFVDVHTGETFSVQADVVAVAADAFRTPQLLWASGIQLPGLGRYLNDQPQVVVGARVNRAAESKRAASVTDQRDALTGVCWVPFDDTSHPFHGQVMQLDTSPIPIDGGDTPDPRPMVGLGWFLAKDLTAEDRVWFDDANPDPYGLPAMRINYRLTNTDHQMVRRALHDLEGLAAELGEQTSEPLLLPAGSSLHYQGTTRMGAADDGTSVCDDHSRVWGFDNLFVGGNGVIPTPTACNPTLTSVALAARAVGAVVTLLDDEATDLTAT